MKNRLLTRLPIITLLSLTVLLTVSCRDDDDILAKNKDYTVTLEEIVLLKKGSNETLPVGNLPAEGETLLQP